MKFKLSIFLIIIVHNILVFTNIIAQKSAFDAIKDGNYRTAKELFEKEQYSAAQKLFIEIAGDPENNNTLIKSNSEYYALICAIELFNDDAEVLGKNFIVLNPESPYLNNALLKLGKFEYSKKRYKQAIGYLTKVNKGELNDDGPGRNIYFKTGYSWFMLDSLDKARKAFYEIKDVDTRYTSPAIYYYSHIAYIQKNYETAIAGFSKLKNDETFAPLVPYYITQSYYYQEKYDELLEYAPNLLDSVVDTRVAEMAKMIGDAYYQKNKFKEAIPFYDKYFEKGKGFTPVDYYQMGYCNYNLGMFDKASKYFEKASLENSSVSQNANYLLGDCYIKTKMKDKALMAFGAASKMDFDLKIKENAAFNYAVLSFELSNSPFNSAIKALNEYISKYPESKKNDEAYHYLVNACLNTHNYHDALTYLNKIKTKDKNFKKAYQRAAFFRGLKVFNNLQIDTSLKYFKHSLKYSETDPLIAARSYYWSGEVYYRLKEIDTALDNYNLFLESPVAEKCQEYNLIFYNIGYCWFNSKDYNQAADRFLKYLNNAKIKKDKFVADAYNRLGDCNFINSKYADALSCYTKAIEIGQSGKDYAIYQKAFTLGLQNEHLKKISLLNQLINSMPESGYNADALYEIGRSCMALQKPDDAKKYYNKLLKDYPSSSNVKKALLQIGLIEYNAGHNDAALANYKKIVEGYPGTDEARSALSGIKNIYVELNDIDSYLKYIENLGDFANVSKAEKDSLLYYTGENAYLAGDCQKAKDNFSKYIEKFPDGDFIVNAWYYSGECQFKANDFENALKSFNYVIGKPKNNFTEPALAKAAKLNMDKKDYNSALHDYQFLDSVAEVSQNIIDARSGKMQALYQMNNYSGAAAAGSEVLKLQNLSQETERQARYVIANSYFFNNQLEKALKQYHKLALDVKNVMGAEAKYRIAEIYYKQGKRTRLKQRYSIS